MIFEKCFQSYAAAFQQQDANAISGFYRFPVTFYLENGTAVSMDQTHFEANVRKLIAQYRQLGMAYVDYRVEHRHQINDALFLVHLTWLLQDQASRPLVTFQTRYLVTLEPAETQILAVFTVDETKKIGRAMVDMN